MPFDAEITTKSRDLIVLEKARERIARGWCQRRVYKDGAVCMGGAIRNPVEDGSYLSQAQGENGDANRIARRPGFRAYCAMAIWNDIPGRTQAEVLARFDAAIERLSGQ